MILEAGCESHDHSPVRGETETDPGGKHAAKRRARATLPPQWDSESEPDLAAEEAKERPDYSLSLIHI